MEPVGTPTTPFLISCIKINYPHAVTAGIRPFQLLPGGKTGVMHQRAKPNRWANSSAGMGLPNK